MGKYGRIVLIGCLLLGQAPPLSIVNAESITEETGLNQDAIESSISEEQEISSVSSDGNEDMTSSNESNSISRTDSSETSQTESSEPIESSNDRSESSRDESNDTEEQRAEVLAENIASGTFRTSDWYITNEGVLHIGSGTLGKLGTNINLWRTYSNQVFKIVIDEGVVANSNSDYLFTSLNRVVEFEV
ncbi:MULTISPECIES: hypothetical protein [unclassified Enterococcus]|uniref:hypothetical protein n=1 Tax=unclassified Enterococcus TaxID=2608891 RepID=UPI0019071C0A|nr:MULTISPECIES: hypothetical protein [unclassified Enterococcus]MBK0037492.1 hypothetical protein [Enterococcus sp. S52]MBK0070383.1 hypothetical protein [Enterococcus sp. S53]MBK0141223.1 hypothetical protein [Enterococcus sp. S76]MBK0144611.1 hypothetical protein [Enterococcus sp. S77]